MEPNRISKEEVKRRLDSRERVVLDTREFCTRCQSA
jgi:hypothetical protein